VITRLDRPKMAQNIRAAGAGRRHCPDYVLAGEHLAKRHKKAASTGKDADAFIKECQSH